MPGLIGHRCEGINEHWATQKEAKVKREVDKQEERWQDVCRLAGLTERRQVMTFESFEQKKQPEAYDAAEHFFTEPMTLVFCGPVGAGKTHLASAILHRWLKTGFDNQINEPKWSLVGGKGYFDTLPSLLVKIRGTFKQGRGKSEDEILKHLIGMPLLVLDDVGKEKATAFSKQTLFNVVDGRYVHSRPLIITSNVTEKKFAEVVDQAVYSRLLEMGKIITMKADYDYRTQKKEWWND